MNRKGNINDILFIVVMLFAIIIGLTAVAKVFNTVSIDINDSSSISAPTKSVLNQADETLPRTLNSLFVLVFFASLLSIAIAAYLIRSSAIFLFVAVILITIFAFVGGVLSNVYEDYLNDYPEMKDYVEENFVTANYLLNNYVLFIVIMAFIALVALYAKTGGNIGTGI